MNKSKIQSITIKYSRLQGLRNLPVGALLLCVSIWEAFRPGDLGVPFLGTVAAISLYVLIDRYYKRIFGQVQQTRRQKNRERIISFIFAVVALMSFVADSAEIVPFSLIGLVFGFAFIFEYLQVTMKIKPVFCLNCLENLAAGIVFLLLSFLPLAGVTWWLWLGFNSQMQGILVSVSCIIILIGLFEHIRIANLLPLTEE